MLQSIPPDLRPVLPTPRPRIASCFRLGLALTRSTMAVLRLPATNPASGGYVEFVKGLDEIPARAIGLAQPIDAKVVLRGDRSRKAQAYAVLAMASAPLTANDDAQATLAKGLEFADAKLDQARYRRLARQAVE